MGTGCFPTAPPVEGDVPSNGSITIAHGASVTNDATPTLTISATGADYMAFSGNGATWSGWVAYSTAYTSFNMITGVGCTTGEGTKTVYVKFKNDAGESVTYHDTIEYDITKPKLSTAVYSDANSSSSVNKGDTITFTFNDEMEKSTITSSNVASRLPLSAGTYGTGPTVSWNTAGTVCTVTLGTSPTIVSGTTVNPSSSVTDVAGNADDSSAVTISGLIKVLDSVSITPPSATTNPGGATVTLTAKALNTASEDITALCTLTWTISGTANGTISPTTGSFTVYTPPPTGTGTDIIKVTASYAGVIKEANATINVITGVPSHPEVDPDKLFVCARTGTAKYTALPPGATLVTVYSGITPDPQLALPTAFITLSDTWTTYVGIAANDYIFFTITDSDGWLSPRTPDGQLPDFPNPIALLSIQATGKDTVTSGPAGNVDGSDQITLFIGPTAYSDPTPVGTVMNLLPGYNLTFGDVPTYTRTNAAGHESIISGADGQILQLITAVPSATGIIGVIELGDTLTLTFSGVAVTVDVTSAIQVSNISWVATAGTAALDNGTGFLAPTDTTGTLTTVVLTATPTCANFAVGEWVTFNIKTDTPIVDSVGGNQVLPAAAAFNFVDGVDF
ncbi:MAG: hypothetical protein KAX30_06445 [Candidatus Atribacteria bacterium]|nr:hypothetical protein [Candidatus Atribacteria bacterium]